MIVEIVVSGGVLAVVLLQVWQLWALRKQLRHMREDVDALSRCVLHAVHTDVPTSMLVTALGHLEQRIALIERQPPPAAQSSYALAQQLAREGADVEQLVSRCGLTREEASLIRQLHSATP